MDNDIKQKQNIRSTTQDSQLSKSLLNLIFISALIIILTVSIISYKQVNNLIKANEWVAHTYRVIQATDKILYSILDIDVHLRGYIISGDTQFMTDVDAVKANLKQNFSHLSHLINDNSTQVARVERLTDLINQRLNIINQIMQMKVTNKLNTDEGMDLFQRGQFISDQVKSAGQEIKSVELILLDERNRLAMDSANSTSFIIIVGSIFSIAGLIVAFFLANKELLRSLKAEQSRKNVEARLRSILGGATDMIAAVDKHYQYIIFNESYQREFKRLFGKSINVGMSLDEALSDAQNSKNNLIEFWKESLQGGEFVKNAEIEINNERNIYEITSSLIKNEANEINGAVHIIRNITKQAQERLELKEYNEKLNAGMQALQDKNDQITLLVEMSDIMLACSSQEELSNVMGKYCQRMLHFASGYLYVMHPSKNYLEVATNWGAPNTQEPTFSPDQCWAIRLGRIHHVGQSHNELICNHVHLSEQQNSSFLCVPLMAQNDIYGLLYMEVVDDNSTAFSDSQRLLINAFSELTALAFANVRLRENLRYQSMRDPLTGLYNRRYLEDFLLKQLHQSERTKSPLAVLMLDLDHFKKINDTYGHDAGDAALKELGRVLQNDIRVGDLAARYGGEEFIIVFYNTEADAIKARAETIRHDVSMLQIKYGAQQVGPITVSIGISVFPKDGHSPTELIESADKALYSAKTKGRNQVVLYAEIESEPQHLNDEQKKLQPPYTNIM